MAINIVCKKCKGNYSTKVKKCKKCGASLDKNCRYKVIVTTPEGKRLTRMLDTVTNARKYEAKLLSQIQDRKLFGILTPITIDEAGEKFIEWAKENKKSWRDDEWRWGKHVLPYLSGRKLDQITPYDVQMVPSQMMTQKPYAPATIKQVLVMIKRVYNWCLQMGLYAGSNPVNNVKLPKVNNEKTEVLTKAECKRLLKFLVSWDNRLVACIIQFAFFSGVRKGEIFNLRWSNVNMKGKMIRLVDTKGGKDTSLPLNSGSMAALAEVRSLIGPQQCEYCFPSPTLTKRTCVRRAWATAKKGAKLQTDFRFHGLRHNFASHLASSGKVSMFALQRLLTHKSPQMTQRYAHLLDETLREGVDVMGSILD